MSLYVIYRRVSTQDQGRSGLGLEAQDRDIELFLQNFAEPGYHILGSFTDIESGTDNGRPGLTEAIQAAKANSATLLVSKLDRLSRRVSFIAGLMDDKKLNFKVAQMPYADKFQLHIYAALAEQERDFISKRTSAALAVKRRLGGKTGGSRPFGAVVHDGKLYPFQEEVEAYHEICRLARIGKSHRVISELMADDGITISEATVLRVLKRGLPKYAEDEFADRATQAAE